MRVLLETCVLSELRHPGEIRAFAAPSNHSKVMNCFSAFYRLER